MGKTWTGKLPSADKPKEKTISEQMEAMIEEICESYCKYPDICRAECEDPDYAEDMLYTKYCEGCPFSKW